MSGTTLREFFDRYSELSQRSEPEPLAAMYAPTFIVAAPRGSAAFVNDARFLEWLQQVHDFNRTHGMRSLAVVDLEELALSPRHTLATVTWGAQFAKTGDRLIEFQIAYLLEATGDTWTILSYISERDQDEAMKELGLI